MRRCILFVAVALLLTVNANSTACAAVPANIIRIAIVGPQNPTQVKLEVGGWASAIGVAMGGGAVAGMLAATRQNDQMPVLQDFKLGDEMNAAVSKSLDAAGYTIVPDSDPHPDAVLAFTLAECKYVRRVWGLIGPRITMDVELRDRTTGNRLFSRSYRYDMHTLGFTGDLTPEDKYGFDTVEEVRAHPDVVAAGLRAAIPMVAADITSALKKK